MRSDVPWWKQLPAEPRLSYALKLKRWPLIQQIGKRLSRFCGTWNRFVRGDVYRMRTPHGAHGHEQRGSRYAVVVQADELLALSTWLVAPTSRSAGPARFRPEIHLLGDKTRVLVEQTAAVDPSRLGEPVGRVTFDELRAIDAALRIVMGI